LLDVRTPKEFAVSHLPGAQLIAPDAKPEDVLAKLDRKRPVVVYCSVGYRSSKLAERLQAAGLAQVMNLEGSIFAWANEDRALEKDGQPATQVHPYNKRYGQMLKPERRAP
jgi:rhodanese-related sulfurtransferase